MNSLNPTYFCPSCRAAFDINVRFCGECGADMHSAQSAPKGRAEPTGKLPTNSTADRWLNRVIDGRYRVQELLGSGGMGAVYKVEHLRIGRIAAMKVLLGELADDPGVVVRFRHEAKAVSMLHHPNTVGVFDFGTEDGALYLIMEYCRGEDLSTIVERDGPIPVLRLAPLIGQICGSLSEAHSLGIVHRDLKPENILVTSTQRGRDFVKVLDFGLAKIGEREDAADITARGLIIGTPYYMSPEQIRGESVDARSDIYSLGATIYTALTGVPPFVADSSIGVLSKHLTAPLVPPSQCNGVSGIPPQIDALVLRAMAKSPANRYQSISEFIDANEEAYAQFLTESQRGSVPPVWGIDRALSNGDSVHYGIESDIRLRRTDLNVFEKSMRTRRRLRIAIVPLVLACIIGAGLYTLIFRPAQPRTVEVEPNNDIYEATLIRPQAPAHGYIGKRISKAAPDKDYYRVVGPPTLDGSTQVTVESTPLPNIDIELLLYSDTGKLLVTADEGGIGLGEAIRGYRVLSPIVVMVSESMRNGPQLPTENVSDQYTVTVNYTPIGNTTEVEPNNNANTAIPLPATQTIMGYLDSRKDQDWFRFSGAAGSYRLQIQGADNVPIVWQSGTSKPSLLRDKTLTLAPGDSISLARHDAERSHGQPLPGASSPYTIRLTPK